MAKGGKITDKQMLFVHEYLYDWNGTRAYKKAYPNVKDTTAASESYKLLRNPLVVEYLKEAQKDLFKLAGVSVLRNIAELRNIAYSSLHNYQSNWMTLNDWDKVSENDKAAIAEVTHVTTNFNGVEKTVVKFKLHSKQAALDSLNKMAGAAGVEKIDHTTNGESLNMSPEEREKRISELMKKAGK